MTNPTSIDHVQVALDRLMWQWKDKPNVTGLVTSYMQSIQHLEEAVRQLHEERGLDTAVGDQLDVLGVIIGLPRGSRTDEQYRKALIQRVAINRSDGSTEAVIEISKLMAESDYVHLFEHFPASVFVYAPVNINSSFQTSLNDICSAGIRASALFDKDGGSFVGGEIVTQTDDLVDHDLNQITLNEESSTANELITNGGFTLDVSSWSTTGTGTPALTHDTNRAKLTAGSSGTVLATQAITLTAGEYYNVKVTLNQDAFVDETPKVYFYNGSTNIEVGSLTAGSNIFSYLATGAETQIRIGSAVAVDSADFIIFDNVSVKLGDINNLIVASVVIDDSGEHSFLPEIVEVAGSIAGSATVTIKPGLGLFLGEYLGGMPA